MCLLLTGFEAFGDSDTNPSERLVSTYQPENSLRIAITTATLPVDTRHAPLELLRLLEHVQPEAVVCFGEAAGRTAISVERIAINLLDFHIADNAGQRITDQPVIESAPAAYFSTLPLRSLVDELNQHAIPAELSQSAGSYLCNQVFFHLMHWVNHRIPHIPAGFIHLPSLPEQMAKREKCGPSMSLETSRRALDLILGHLMVVERKGETS